MVANFGEQDGERPFMGGISAKRGRVRDLSQNHKGERLYVAEDKIGDKDFTKMDALKYKRASAVSNGGGL